MNNRLDLIGKNSLSQRRKERKVKKLFYQKNPQGQAAGLPLLCVLCAFARNLYQFAFRSASSYKNWERSEILASIYLLKFRLAAHFSTPEAENTVFESELV